MASPPRTLTPAAMPSTSQWEGWHRYVLLSVLALLLLLGVAWTAFVSGDQLRLTHARVTQQQQALKDIATVLQMIVDMESGQRGYLLTDNEAYLEQYERADRDIGEQLRQLDEQLAASPELRSDLAFAQAMLGRKRGEIAASLSLYRSQGRDAALALIRTDLGKQAMDEVRASLTQLSLRLRGEIAQQQDALQRTMQTRNVSIYVALGLAMAAGIAGLILLRRHLGALREEERLRTEAERAERASREKSSFLAHISHEIRTPMNAIFGFSQLLADRVTDAQSRRYVDAILTSGRALLALINDVLDLSKIEAGRLDVRPVPMRLREVIESVITVFSQLAAEKGLTLSSAIDTSLPDAVELDPGRVRQMLFNLVGNALKYTDRGRIMVHAAATVESGAETRVLCTIKVEDTGIGIRAEDFERIFEPFAQARGSEAREGTGLGLGITRRLARLMGGDVDVRSTLGEGSTFRIVLPGVPLAVLSEPPSPLRGGELRDLPPTTILVVDDISLNRELIAAMFLGTHHQVFQAADGERGIELARLHRPQIVLMDIRMPGIDGLTALEHLRAEPTLAQTCVIALTASSLLGEESQLRERFDGYLRKPVSRELLLAELSRLLAPAPALPEMVTDPASLADVLVELAAIERGIWQELRGSLAVRDSARLAERLDVLAQRSGAGGLRDYAAKLRYAADMFDPLALETVLAEFPLQQARLAAAASARSNDESE